MILLRCIKLFYYFDSFVSIIFYLMGLYLMLIDLYYELFIFDKIDFVGIVLMVFILIFGGLLFCWLVYVDIKVINCYW